MDRKDTGTTPEYEKPQVVDFGDLRELTESTNVGPQLDGHFDHVREVFVSP